MLCLLVMGSYYAHSQEDSIVYTKGFLDSINIDDLFKYKPAKSYFKIQASYLSNSVYQGRKDSLLTPYLTPVIEYNHKSGLYASASLSYLSNDSARVDVYNFDVGYSFNATKRFGGSVYLNKPIYNNQSNNVQSDTKFEIGGSSTYNASVVNINASGNVIFGSSKNDFALTLSLDHPFSLSSDTSKSTFTITPTVAAYFGTSGTYQNYKRKKEEKLGLHQQNQPSAQQQYNLSVNSNASFQIMSYEFSLPINFDSDKWGLFLTPTYVAAVNPITTVYKLTKPNGQEVPLPYTYTPDPQHPLKKVTIPATQIEKISNSFYVEMGCYFKF